MNILSPIGSLYGKIADLRNTLYDRGVLRSYSLGAKTISIGNITTGGTGKTPVVAHVVEILAGSGEKVCVLTRGYGRKDPRKRVLVSDWKKVLVDARIGGDEPVELARKLLGKAIVVADADRVSAAAWTKEKFGVTAFVLDDAFQHRRAQRDLDIVCIDAMDPFGSGRVLPAGTLREPFANLRRAEAILITRSDLVDSTAAIGERLRRRNSQAPIFETEFRIAKLTPLANFLEGKTDGKALPEKLFAFCGLGNPESFFSQLAAREHKIAGTLPFADHHRYRQHDILRIEGKARTLGASGLVTTGKDAVKLTKLELKMPCFVAEAETVFTDAAAFRDLVLSA